MKILLVSCDADYGAMTFEQKFAGQKVSDIIIDVEAGKTFEIYDEDPDYGPVELDMRVYSFGEVDRKFIEFIKDDVMDYDQSKHQNFYVEGDTI